jgi:hypothetical protein
MGEVLIKKYCLGCLYPNPYFIINPFEIFAVTPETRALPPGNENAKIIVARYYPIITIGIRGLVAEKLDCMIGI